jgi:hypothetical protein
VRWLAFLCLLLFVSTVRPQDQQRSLIDRLLRPNMDLQNRQQGKVFRADSKVVAHRGAAKEFVLERTANGKTFSDTRVAEVKEYPLRSIRADAQQNTVVKTRQVNVPAQLTLSSVRDLHPAYDAHLAVSGRNFADERAFRDQGKSQKSLSHQNPPLTIDQVRELLNKNK